MHRFSIQSKLSQHINNEEKVTHNQERNQSSGTGPEMIEIIELADNHFTK